MKTILLAVIVLSATHATAHEDHDWREDHMAYLMVNYDPAPPIFESLKKIFKLPKEKALDMGFFKAKLEVLTGEKPFRFQGKEVLINERKSDTSLIHTRAFLAEEYSKLGYQVSYHPFGGGINFIAEKIGTTTPEKVLILSSHIDSVGNKGANDNGTGTIGLLTAARLMAKEKFASTVRILGFDKEELGLKGSDAYVPTISGKEQIIGNINIEMMGVNSRKDGAFHVIDCDRADSKFLSKEISDSILELDLPLSVVKTCTTRSDHASFWRNNIPAVVISENFFGGDSDPCYHDVCDVVDERLNYEYMENILNAVVSATKKLANK